MTPTDYINILVKYDISIIEKLEFLNESYNDQEIDQILKELENRDRLLNLILDLKSKNSFDHVKHSSQEISKNQQRITQLLTELKSRLRLEIKKTMSHKKSISSYNSKNVK